MDYLGRQSAPFSDELWRQIDSAVIETAKDALLGRRFLPFFGPIGPGFNSAEISAPSKEEVFKDGFSVLEGRQLVKVPQLYEDFWLYWRDMEDSRRQNFPLDLTAARVSSQKLAQREDQMIFYGVKNLGLDGLLTVKGVNSQPSGDWNKGEDAFMAIVTAVSTLSKKGRLGNHCLITSPDLFVALHRLQPGTGLMEIDRVKSIVGGRVFKATALEPKTALLVCAQPQYIDLMVGQDISAAYTETVDLNHHFRILETAVLRIKSPDAIVVFK